MSIFKPPSNISQTIQSEVKNEFNSFVFSNNAGGGGTSYYNRSNTKTIHPDDAIDYIAGIAGKTQQRLESLYNVKTVGELAAIPRDKLSRDHLPFYDEAVQLVQAHHQRQKQLKSNNNNHHHNYVDVQEVKPAEPAKLDMTLLDKYMIKNHTWFEARIQLPSRTGQLKEAIVYELNIIRGNDPSIPAQVGFTVGHFSQIKKKFVFLEEFISAPFILHFNPQLPLLKLFIHHQDTHPITLHILHSTLNEIHLMQSIT
jgi:hypothetical protein